MKLPGEDDIEIVSNSNGTAYKFKNGLMIVTQKFEVKIAQSDWHAWGDLKAASIEDGIIPNFPVAFSEIPTISRSLRGVTNGNAWISSNLAAENTTKSSAFDVIRPTQPTNTITLEISIIAIGKWK